MLVTSTEPAYVSTCASVTVTCVSLNISNQVWAEVFAKAVEGKNLKEILLAFGAASPSAPAAGAGAAAAEGGVAAAAAEEAAPEEEESDEDMGMGLFD